MGDEFDVDDLLEAALYKSVSTDSSKQGKESNTNGHRDSKDSANDDDGDEYERDRKDKKSRRRSRSRSSGKDRDSKRSRHDRDRDDGHSRDRERRRSRDRRRSRSRDRRDRDDRDIRRRRSRSRERVDRVPRNPDRGTRDRSSTPPRLRPGPKKRSRSPQKLGGDTPLSPEDRDARTVFCMQLSQRVRVRDLEDFFSSVGKVRDVRMITCNKTRRFKGIAYIEFRDIESVALALGLGGQKLLGVPIIVQPSQAEKNRAGQLAKAGAMAAAMSTTAPGPMKLYVGSLHFNITEEMLRGIFEPFGRIDEITLMKDHETGRSKGFGFLTFREGEDAKRAMEQLNGFEIAGRPMKVGYVTEKAEGQYTYNPQTILDSDEMDRAGVNLGVTGRLQLMAKLAEGTDLKLPEAATTALNLQSQINQNAFAAAQVAVANSSVPSGMTSGTPSIATQCFMLSNMFDPMKELGNPKFEGDIRDEVLEACIPHGGALHIYVDMNSPGGNVYVKCPSVNASVAAVNALHGRWFGGRVTITAAYVPILNYHSLFADSMAAQTILQPSKKLN